MIPTILGWDEIHRANVAMVGAKALGLGQMHAAGLPVPEGFCISTSAYLRLRSRSLAEDPALAAEIGAAHQELGGGLVAVRSSATLEDSPEASYAGQFETVLGVSSQADLLAAVEKCWASLGSDHVRAYHRQVRADGQEPAMAVIVQRLVPAEVAGVLLSRDPFDAVDNCVLVEAAWGLGESVVAGRVTPDRYRLGRETGQVQDEQVGVKPICRTAAGLQAVSPEKQRVSCLDSARLSELYRLALQVKAVFGGEQDVEWAWCEGHFWLLQARPITGISQAERERIRAEEVSALQRRANPEGTVWSRLHLAEVLPAPTPMTWSILHRLLAGRGGTGLMYRDLGFDPDPQLDEEGVYDLICGRPYCNLSRDARMHFHTLPIEYPFDQLKADSRQALHPLPRFNPARLGASFWLLFPIRLPELIFGLLRAETRWRNLCGTFPLHFRKSVIPAFLRDIDSEAAADLRLLDGMLLLERLEFWMQRTLVDFARESLKPTALAGLMLGALEAKLARTLGAERSRAALRDLLVGIHPDPEADFPEALLDLRAGRLDREAFLQQFGHRGNQEMELAEPRWAEMHDSLGYLHQGKAPVSPVGWEEVWQRVAREAGLSRARESQLYAQLTGLRQLLGLRETAKHYLMMGYAQIRRILLELDRRYDLQCGIFYLQLGDLQRLVAGEKFREQIARARRRRAVCLSIPVPQVLFSDGLEAIGKSAEKETGCSWGGLSVSPGVARGPALVMKVPARVDCPSGYILVCPGSDPAWAPLLLNAAGLVFESGGMLSHGAILARELGLPAVTALPGILNNIRSGLAIEVDGARGTVTVLDPE